jgi:NAD(P)-dependent dehydrogenase (short-subunit alcohol dehydrogenase family)
LLLGSKGAKVVVNDSGVSLHGRGVDTGPAVEVAREIEAAGGEAVACAESVATPEGGRAIVNTALDTYGRIDILIHNAGIVRHASMREMSQDDLDAVLDVHLRGAFHSSVGGIYGNHKVANYGMAKAGMVGLSNVVALEGAAAGVKCNVIVPGAVTRMAEGINTANFPATMRPDVVAPVVGWLAHESCSITGEMLVSMAGRVARVFFAESPGVYRDAWTIEQVAEHMNEIRNADAPLIFPVVPSGHAEHIRYSFDMAGGGGRGAEVISH